MVVRYPIEKWSRPQLEDKYHNLSEEYQNAQKKIKELDKQIANFNSRFRRNLLERKTREDEVVAKEKYEDVVKENQILDMKLKAAKHQLLIYTAPSARAATASVMTGRSTFRQQQTTWRQNRQNNTGVSIERTMATTKKKNENGEKLQLGTEDKMIIVRLNRTLKNKNDEISELKKTIESLKHNNTNGTIRRQLESSSSSSTNNNNGPDNKDSDEDYDDKSEFSELSEMTNSSRSDEQETKKRNKKKMISEDIQVISPRKGREQQQQSEKILMDRLRVFENDIQILRDECEILKNANERLIHQSLTKGLDYGARENMEEKKKMIELEEQLKDVERRLKESESKRKEEQKKYDNMRIHYQTKSQKKSEIEEQIREERQREKEQQYNPPPTFEPSRKRVSQAQNELMRMRQHDDDILEKLYNEVSEILETHDIGGDNIIIKEANTMAKWQKLYSEIYEELEKVRNMLLIQYDINQKQTSEVNLLQNELIRLQTISNDNDGKVKELLEEKQKRIFLLEEQLRTIAYSGQQQVNILKQPVTPTSNILTDLSFKLINVKPSSELTSNFFFSLEFFDFQLETTPIMEPKQQIMDFTTVYDVIVSNLLIHYMQTNGIVIEMYRPSHDKYKLIATAVVILTPLFDDSTMRKYCSEIVLKSIKTGNDMCTLRYEIEVSQPFTDSFNKFKKSDMAKNMIPLQIDEMKEQEDDFEPLIIMINRVQGLETLNRDDGIEFCVVYEFLSFSPYYTDFSTSSELNSKRTCSIPKTETARDLFSSTNISLYILENSTDPNCVISILHLPLYPLLKAGGSIKGSFPMLDADNQPSQIYLDLCVMWKHEKPAFFMKHTEYEEDTPILPKPVKRLSKQFDVTPVDESELLRKDDGEKKETVYDGYVKQSDTVVTQPSATVPLSPSSSSSSSSKDVFSPPRLTEPSVFDFNQSESEYENYNKPQEEEDEDDFKVDTVYAKPRATRRKSLDDIIKSESDVPKQEEAVVEQQKEERVEEKKEDERRETDQLPKKEKDAVEEGKGMSDSASTPPTQISVEEIIEESVDDEEDVRKQQEREELSKLLGVVPSFPPIAKPRNSLSDQQLRGIPTGEENTKTTRIVISDRHRSIPPSLSSTSSSPRPEKPPVPLPDYTGPGLIKVSKPLSPPDNDTLLPGVTLLITIEDFQLYPHSKLQMRQYDNNYVQIEFSFLDYPNEETRSPVFILPRRASEPADMLFTKEYTLTRRQVTLLKQNIELKIRNEVALVRVSPGEEEDISWSTYTIQNDNALNKLITIDFTDRDAMQSFAEAVVTIQFSNELKRRLE